MLDDIINKGEKRMKKTVRATANKLAHIRSGKANPKLLESIRVDYYGTETPLQEIANISAPEPRLLVIQPWDQNALEPIEKAIHKSDLGLNPMNDGNVIRLKIPTPTEERRKKLVKNAKEFLEEGKVALRSIRRDVLDELEQLADEGELSEDYYYKGEEQIQDLIDKYTDKLEKLFEQKKEEVLEL